MSGLVNTDLISSIWRVTQSLLFGKHPYKVCICFSNAAATIQ